MKYHLIGDQGVSMRGINKYLKYLGHEVTGSDIKTIGHNADNVKNDVDIVVRSSAINPGSDGWCEVEAAHKLDKSVIKRSQLLGELTRKKNLIAISGMHGKTTITTMAGLLFIEAGLDPTVLVGENVKEFNDVIKIGNSEWFIMEACEYDRSFLDFYPKIVILTNIDEEHLDTYPNGLPEIKEAFIEYLNHVPDNGAIIACVDDKNVIEILSKIKTKAKVIRYGEFSDKYNSLDFKLNIPGKHNILNALSVLALADYVGIDKQIFKKTMLKFTGAKRRFEYRGNFNGADLIDDYGHHPTEIMATIEALKEKYPDKKNIVVFWPHQYRRILPLLDKFAEAFSQADEVIIKPIFFVPGRDERLNIDSSDIVKIIQKNDSQKKVTLFHTDDKIVEYLKKELNKDCVLLTIGIPPVYKIEEALLELKV